MSSGLAGGNPSLSCNKDGTAAVVWEQSDGSRMNIWALCYAKESGWDFAKIIEQNSGTAINPQVAVDGMGNAIAVWQQSDGTRNNILSNRYTVDSGWGTDTLIESGNKDSSNPRIAISKTGIAMVTWQDYEGSSFFSSWSNRYVIQTGWNTPVRVQTNLRDAEQPQIAIDNSGNAIAMWKYWSGDRTSFSTIFCNFYFPDTGWSVANSVGEGPAASSGMRIAILDQENALVLWDGDFITANHYAPQTGWSSTNGIVVYRGGRTSNLQIAANNSGSAIAVWQETNGTEKNIWCNRYSPITGWGTAELVEMDPGDAEKPQVVLDDLGNAIVVWQQSNGTSKEIRANHYTAGRGWDGAEVIGRAGVWGDMIDPQIAIDGAGNAIAVWSQSDAGRFALWASHYRLAGEID